MARLMNQARVDWTFSTDGYESTNFGFLSGKSHIAKHAIEKIVDAAEKVGAKTVVIPECGHAYGVLRWSGANILGRPLPFQVLHITEYLAQLKKEGKLKFNKMEGSLTYHDPCQISRRGGATDAARYLLEDDYEVDLPLDRDQAEVLLTVSSIEMMKYPKSIVAMARLMNQARVDWTFSTDGYESPADDG
jgi:Fe-S oxidoreductase